VLTSYGATGADFMARLLLVNEIRTDYAAHRVKTSASTHGAADTTNVVTHGAAVDNPTALFLARQLKTMLNAHEVLTTGGVHGAADNTNTVTSALPYFGRPLRYEQAGMLKISGLELRLADPTSECEMLLSAAPGQQSYVEEFGSYLGAGVSKDISGTSYRGQANGLADSDFGALFLHHGGRGLQFTTVPGIDAGGQIPKDSLALDTSNRLFYADHARTRVWRCGTNGFEILTTITAPTYTATTSVVTPFVQPSTGTPAAAGFIRGCHDTTVVASRGFGAYDLKLIQVGGGTNDLVRFGDTSSSLAYLELEAGGGTGALKNGTNSALIWADNALGFYGHSAVARSSAYTQTFATASRTTPNQTQDTLTDNSGGAAGTTLAAITGGGAGCENATKNAVASLAAQLAKVKADVDAAKQNINSIIDDLQANGMFQ